MKIGKMELTQEKMLIALLAVIVGGAVVVYFLLYAPLMRQLRTEYVECRAIENEVLDYRNIIEAAGKVYGERVLTPEKDNALTINELTKHGRLNGIDFVSMNPQEIREKNKNGLLYKILPVKMKLRSGYQQLGMFLGSLDELEKGLVVVKSFDVTAGKKDPSELMTEMTAYIYLSGRE